MAEVMTAQKVAARTEDAVKVYGKGQTEVRALDGVTVEFAAGRYTAIMGPSGSGKSTLLHCVAGLDTLDANFAIRYDTQVFVKKAPGVSTAAALAAVRGVATRYSGTTVMDQAAFKAAQAKPIQQMLSLVYALLALAILIALLGIGNTLALSIFERTRELGVMRAVGMTRPQLRAMIRWESVIIALQGTVLGLLIGVFFG